MFQKTVLENLFDKTTVALRTMGFRESSFADITFTFLFWKYLSDTTKDATRKMFTYAGDEANFNLINSSNLNKKLSVDITEALNKWSAKNDFANLLVLDFKSVNAQFLPNIMHYWSEAFSQLGSNFWSTENIALSFEILSKHLSNEFTGAHLLFTPHEIENLIEALIDPLEKTSIYDPFCRSGSLLFAVSNRIKEKKRTVGVTADFISYRASKIYSLMVDPSASIEMKPFAQLFYRQEEFDVIVTNPPFGHSSIIHPFGEGFWTTQYPSKRIETTYVTHCLDHLSDKGQAVVVVPKGFLSWSDKTVNLRKKLVEENLLEAVIELPQKVFYGTGSSTALLLFNKLKKSKKTLFVNASNLGIKEKERTKLTIEDNEKLKNFVHSFRKSKSPEVQGVVQILTQKEIAENNYGFVFKQSTEIGITRRNSAEILAESAELEQELVAIQKQIAFLSQLK